MRHALQTPRPQFFHLILGFGFLALMGMSPAFGADCDGWCAQGRNEDRLELTAVSYEIEQYGALALGRLVLGFRNSSEEPIRARYHLPPGLPFRADDLRVSVEGQAVGESSEPATPEARAARGPRGREPQEKTARRSPASGVAVVGPGETAFVEVGYRQTLPVEEGLICLRVAAPPLTILAAGERSASRVASPPALPVPVRVVVHHGDPLRRAESPTHDIHEKYAGDRTVVELTHGDLAGKDFELRFAVGTEDRPTLLAYVGPPRDGVRDVAAVLTPPPSPREGSARAKSMIFVLDTSGSMSGEKLDRAREALYASIERLAEGDRLNIVEFDNDFTWMRPEPVVVADESRRQAADWLRGQTAGGGTMLFPALKAAFGQPGGETLHRMIVVLTDGNVGDPVEVDNLLKAELGDARLFFVGIGADVNQGNILRFAETGRGTAAFAEEATKIVSAVASLFDSVSRPLAWDLEIDWGGAQVESIEPRKLPDLYAGRPVTLFAKVRGEPPDELRLRASTADGEQEFTIVLPTAELAALPRASSRP